MNVREASMLPYQREQRRKRLEMALPVSLGAASLTIGGSSIAAGQVASGALQLDRLDPGQAAGAFMPLRIASGAMAVANIGVGLYKLFGDEDEEKTAWQIASAAGNFVTAAGLAGQALAWGPWTAAVTGLGVATTLVADIVQRKRGE